MANKKMMIIASKGSLDMAYPPLILATMDVMDVKQSEIIDGVEFGGAATWLDEAADSQINLFI